MYSVKSHSNKGCSLLPKAQEKASTQRQKLSDSNSRHALRKIAAFYLSDTVTMAAKCWTGPQILLWFGFHSVSQHPSPSLHPSRAGRENKETLPTPSSLSVTAVLITERACLSSTQPVNHDITLLHVGRYSSVSGLSQLSYNMEVTPTLPSVEAISGTKERDFCSSNKV